jgi:hypothetical protein
MTPIALVFGCLLGSFLCEWVFSRQRRALERSIRLRDEFFASAILLVRDPETPASVVELMVACANTITRPEVGRLVIRRALTDRLPAMADNEDPEESLQFMRDVHGMRDDLRQALADAAWQYAQAVSFNNTVLGGVVRRFAGIWLASGPTHSAERFMVDVTPPFAARDGIPVNP